MPKTLIGLETNVDVSEIRPCEDHVLLKLLSREQTQGGIWLPKNTATPCRVGKVLAAGKEIPNRHSGRGFPVNAKIGGFVLFMDYAGERVQAAWEDYRLVRESALWADVELSAGDDLINFESVAPRADRLLLELSDESMSKGGAIHLPMKDLAIRWRVGQVKSSGYGIWHLEAGYLMENAAKAGDKVIFRRYSGVDLAVRGKDYRLVQEIDVMAILDDQGGIAKAVGGNVIIERAEADGKTKGGIIIPDRAKERLRYGKVVAADRGVPYANGEPRRLGVEPGQIAVFKMGVEDVTYNDKHYTICDGKEIMAVHE